MARSRHSFRRRLAVSSDKRAFLSRNLPLVVLRSLRLIPGEYLVERIENVEDTKGNNVRRNLRARARARKGGGTRRFAGRQRNVARYEHSPRLVRGRYAAHKLEHRL